MKLLKLIHKFISKSFLMLYFLVSDPNYFLFLVNASIQSLIKSLKKLTFTSVINSIKNLTFNILSNYNNIFKFLSILFKFIYHLNAMLGIGIVIYFNPLS